MPDLDKDIRLNTTYLSSDWDGTSQTHTLTLKSHDDTYQHVTDVLISANGPLSRPLLPNIPGRDTFKGIAIHNLNWRKHDIDFTGMRIAVIGNGSSGIQLLPGLAEIPGVSITQYVRSGGYYYPKVNTPFHAWQRFALDWVPGFRFCYRSVLFRRQHDRSQARGRQNAAGHAEEEKMLLAYLEKNAPAEYLDALRPAYRESLVTGTSKLTAALGCKRPAFDAGWLAALHRSNVTLNGQGIREITEDSIIDNAGAIAPVDIIIFATGADVGRHGVGLNENLHGEDGVELKAYWQSLGGPQAYRGLSVPKVRSYRVC
jgi:cation diffusion facilitator CzcD-associated flavoprotein CzcO